MAHDSVLTKSIPSQSVIVTAESPPAAIEYRPNLQPDTVPPENKFAITSATLVAAAFIPIATFVRFVVEAVLAKLIESRKAEF
jgi:hypothetical protein